jgi:hypothetical protein
VAGSCCAQLIWLRQTLMDYGYTLNNVHVLRDNESVTPTFYKNKNFVQIGVHVKMHIKL